MSAFLCDMYNLKHVHSLVNLVNHQNEQLILVPTNWKTVELLDRDSFHFFFQLRINQYHFSHFIKCAVFFRKILSLRRLLTLDTCLLAGLFPKFLTTFILLVIKRFFDKGGCFNYACCFNYFCSVLIRLLLLSEKLMFWPEETQNLLLFALVKNVLLYKERNPDMVYMSYRFQFAVIKK